MQAASEHEGVFKSLFHPDRRGLSKHMRLTDALAQAIASGHWGAGDKLPTEEELVRLTPFSLGTIQRSLRSLADQGVVVRHHGLGTFVAEVGLPLKSPWHCRFLDDDGETLLPVYSKVVSRELERQIGAWTEYFPRAHDHLMRIVRIINVNNEFNVLAVFYGDSRRMPSLWTLPQQSLDGLNIKDVLLRELNTPITRIAHKVRCEKFDSHVVRMIGAAEGDAGIFLQATAHMGESICVYYEEFFIPMTRRRLSIPEHIPFSARL